MRGKIKSKHNQLVESDRQERVLSCEVAGTVVRRKATRNKGVDALDHRDLMQCSSYHRLGSCLSR